jgi:quercetin dioxygenase-like cupin family protein
MTNPNRRIDRSWHTAPTPGVTYAVLRSHGDGEGATLITRFAAGTRGGHHHHPGGEELLILEGECEANGIRLSQGDYLYTPPGEDHELVALTDTKVFVHLPKLPIYGKE